MIRKIFILIFVIAVMLAIGGCAYKPHTQSPFTLTTEHPQQVTLMVPLHGDLADSGMAIRNGFLAAYYYSLQHGQSDTAITVMDTSVGNVTALYQQAINNGADFVVGPLTKQNVQALTNLDSLPVTTLALNTVDNYMTTSVTNLYQFGLFSLDEVTQVATRAWQEHPGRAMIIAPNSVWGQAMASVLQNTWQALGGSVTSTLMYNNNLSLNQQIKHALNIDSSQNNAKMLQEILWRNFKFIPRRRQDIDVILLVAPPKQARQIRPLLQFYFAGDLPVYATSIIYAGIPQPNLDRDLDGIMFCDMPWLLRNSANLPAILPILRKNIVTLWPRSYQRYSRLYALGIDAYYLMLNLPKLLQNPNTGIAGATGMFYIDNYEHIYRQLDWAQMRDGKPYLLP